ncbi:hypothetical protein CKO24_13505 [Rhodothalassium salexigens DSM 2132]|nr:hypothetical protein [Rhodothalassium salexigens DSM 2132]
MVMEVEAQDPSGADEELATLERRRLSGRRLVILGLPMVFGVTVILVGGMLLLGGGDAPDMASAPGTESAPPSQDKDQGEDDHGDDHGGDAKGEGAANGTEAAPGIVYCDPNDFLVNLNTGGRRATYLKLQVQFEVGAPAACGTLEAAMPVVKNNFQAFLRELRPEELSGSAGNYRLKEELLVRVNRAVPAGTVRDVHITEFLVQ